MKRYKIQSEYKDILSENRFPKHQKAGLDYLKKQGISSFDIDRLENLLGNGANIKVIRAFVTGLGLDIDQMDMFFKLYNF